LAVMVNIYKEPFERGDKCSLNLPADDHLHRSNPRILKNSVSSFEVVFKLTIRMWF
jgi:hypothetical protein